MTVPTIDDRAVIDKLIIDKLIREAAAAYALTYGAVRLAAQLATRLRALVARLQSGDPPSAAELRHEMADIRRLDKQIDHDLAISERMAREMAEHVRKAPAGRA